MSVLALIPARDEAGRVGATVEAARALADAVVVVDDGSTDGTADEARSAGARVLVPPEPLGKGGALEGALRRLDAADVYLFLDADLGASAKEAGPLLDEVRSGRADLAVAVLPPDPRHGGFRIVKRAAAGVIRALCGFRVAEPLSGQRALSAEVLASVRPLAPGFGVEVAMTVDAVRAGYRVAEISVPMHHAPTGRTVAGFRHRGRQGWDLLRAAAPRLVTRT